MVTNTSWPAGNSCPLGELKKKEEKGRNLFWSSTCNTLRNGLFILHSLIHAQIWQGSVWLYYGNPLPPISHEKIIPSGISLKWSTRAAVKHSRLPTGRSKMPVAMFHHLNVSVIQPVPNGKDKFDHN